MGSASNELVGPDFRQGVKLTDLVETQPLAGHIDGQAALLIRTASDVVAIGATCTHYSGPLRDGVLTGELIRCPWHHACFSIRTGQALAPPALNPLPRWATRIEAGRVLIGDLLEAPAVGTTLRENPAAIVIIGAGAAGAKAAETLREAGYVGTVTMIDPDADAPYDRPNLSKDYLAGNAPEEWLPLRGAEFYDEQRITRIQERVVSIDVVRRTIELANGRQVRFDKLLIATGAAPLRPPIPGSDRAHVHVLRSLADCRALIAAAQKARHVVIAGASFIGMEAAAALRTRGVAVTVVAPEAVPFTRVLGEELGVMLRAQHAAHGVSFQLGHTIQSIADDHVLLDNGERIAADVVLLGVGVRPSLELAESAGLHIDNGIVVNEYLESSAPGIYAAGDIARFPDARTGAPIRIEHWVVAQRQGQTAARNMLGARAAFTSVPFFWTQQYEVPVAYTGHAQEWDEVRIDGDVAAHDCAVSYLRAGRVLAVATINRDQENLRAEIALEQESHTAH